METAVVWFRRDLRVHDNETLRSASTADRVVPVYVFQPTAYNIHEYGGTGGFRYQKTGPHRTRFRQEAVEGLRSRLRELGSELIVRRGDPAETLRRLVTKVDANRVHLSTYPTPEERRRENQVKDAIREAGAEPRRAWTHTLHHISDLPDDYRTISDTFTPFKQTVESNCRVREPLAVPSLPPLPDTQVNSGSIPSAELMRESSESPEIPDDSHAVPRGIDDNGDTPGGKSTVEFGGGEQRGRERVREYIWKRDCLRRYRDTRNGMLGADFSSKFSPWLNQGCLSPRYVHQEVAQYENDRVSNESTEWLIVELRWRDFFQFQVAKHGESYFEREGIRARNDIEWREAPGELKRWARGDTGIPFIDANMRELNQTGYMSNRGRQNVASFLTNNLQIDWRKGAAYFETQLIDYDPCSNYGNWAYVAGVGNDSRTRGFDIMRQATEYDPNAEYIRQWLPELESVPPEYAHSPWEMSSREQAQHQTHLGIDYPRPMVRFETND